MIPLIDSARYPLDQADHPATEALVARCRAELAERAVCVVERLLTPAALAAMAAEAERLAPLAHHRAARRNCYIGVENDPSLPASHPRRRFMATTLGVVADDLIPADALVRELYDWPAFQGFLAAIMGYPALYPNEDRFQALNVIVYEPGEQSDWHFDPDNDFTVTLLLQEAEEGGDFSLVPDIRGTADENYDRRRARARRRRSARRPRRQAARLAGRLPRPRFAPPRRHRARRTTPARRRDVLRGPPRRGRRPGGQRRHLRPPRRRA